ncbi:hypothetical protein PoB_006930700 [Plakobranchus ocellatus]|uniref:Uncharacterized protein n=1 Tax=Plakobranchus ocellatus TaxID=259542 RepID=A0AAV4DFM0_9GAST|nr:hypothetical protein PoB_006930700 [Plakobranchus ocellatus]
MTFLDQKQNNYQDQPFLSSLHRRYQRPHHHHYYHYHHCSQYQPHKCSQSALLLPRSLTTLVSILLLSSALTLPSCRALDSISQSSVAPTNNDRHLKRTILPFHFKLLQDYLHQHGIGGGRARGGHHIRYPAEMLFPPGVRIMSRSSSPTHFTRSRRSTPLRDIALELRSKSYGQFDSLNRSPDDSAVSAAVPSYSYFGDSSVESIQYPRHTEYVSNFKSPKLKSKQFPYRNRLDQAKTSRYFLKMKQKQDILDALRRRDKAQAAAARRDRFASSRYPQMLPSLSEASIMALETLAAKKTQKPFVRKQKSQKHHAAATFLMGQHDPQGFQDDLFVPLSDNSFKVQTSFSGNVNDLQGRHSNGQHIAEPVAGLGKVEWFVSPPQKSPLLSATENEDFFSAPIITSDTVLQDSRDDLAFENGFGNDQGFSKMSFDPSDSNLGDDFVSAASFSATGSFGSPVTFPDSPSGSDIVASSFGSPQEAGVGGFWGGGEFSSDDKDCADILTKTCVANSDCSCYGFYVCSSRNRCEPMKGELSQ